jgi:hypothetical protein
VHNLPVLKPVEETTRSRSPVVPVFGGLIRPRRAQLAIFGG